ncbi:MAG: hypothetical protein JXR14_00385 [Paracoccaceae bacterium]
MSALRFLFDKLRVFWLGFMVAVAGMTGAGIFAGHINPIEMQIALMEWRQDNALLDPQSLPESMRGVLRVEPADSEAESQRFKNNLAALRQRQQAMSNP